MAKLQLENLPIKPSPDDQILEEKIGLFTDDRPPRNAEDQLSKKTVRAVLEGTSDQSLLRPSIDREKAAEVFQRNGAVRVSNLFRPEVAEYFYQDIHEKISWNLRYKQGGERNSIPPEEWKSYSEQERRSLYDRIGRGAKGQYQAFYHRYSLDPDESQHLIDHLPHYIERPEYQNLIESLSGTKHKPPIQAWVSRMQSGHFLRMHNDGHFEGFSSTLQFTKNWSPDWGGVLSLTDPDGTVLRSFAPEFNSLVLIKVPVIHYVSRIAPYATGTRYIVSIPGGTQ